MSNPTKPEIDYSYAGFQQEFQDNPFPGTQLDNDLAELETSIDQTIDALADVRRPDGALNNGIVTADSLSEDLLIGLKSPTAWATSTRYVVLDCVTVSEPGLQGVYRCTVSHESADFSDDLAAGYWELIFLLTADGLDLADVAVSGQYDDLLGKPTIGNVVTSSDFGSVANCTAQGVGTDIGPSLLAAWNYAIATYGHGAKISVPAGRYRGASPGIVLDGQGKHDITLEILGTITTDNVAMNFITVQNCVGLKLVGSFFEGGRWTNGAANQGYYVDYSTTGDVAGGGGQAAILIQGVFDCTVDISAYGYGGRAVQVGTRVNVNHPQTGAIKGRIKTGRNHDFSKPRVAQSIWSDTAVVGLGNWGHLDTLICDFDIWGPVWRNWNDISVSEIDTAFNKTGIILEGCVVAEFDNLYVGSIDGNPTNKHLSIVPSAERNSGQVRVSKMRFLDAGHGVYVKNAESVKVGQLEGGGAGSLRFIEIENSQNVIVENATCNGGQRALHITGANTDQIYIGLSTRGTMTDDQVFISSEVNGAITLDNANLVNAAAGKSLVKAAGAALVLMHNPLLFSTNGNLLDLVAGNNVHLRSGAIGGTAALYKVAEARTILGTKGAGTGRLEDGLKLAGNAVWAPPSSDFVSTANGYERLPDGRIRQWGFVAPVAAGDVVVTFPIPFPTKLLSIPAPVMVSTGIGPTSMLGCSIKSQNPAGFTVERRFTTAGTTGQATEGFFWEAVGH